MAAALQKKSASISGTIAAAKTTSEHLNHSTEKSEEHLTSSS
jgi:hypothetical protein